MCGIFGMFNAKGGVSPRLVKQATSALKHRGPNDEGYLLANSGTKVVRIFGGDDTDTRLGLPHIASAEGTAADLAFGFRRLSILDLSTAGHQPMGGADNNVWIILNGEIYNYIELRAELQHPEQDWPGYRFKSESDTEVVLASYLRWGEKCIEKFVGMFALAIYDARNSSLFLARDPFGIKPLHYTTAGETFAFASEIPALLALPWVDRRADRSQLRDYLEDGLHDHSPQTFFADIKRLMPRQSLTLKLKAGSKPTIKDYWTPQRRQSDPTSFDLARERVRDLFEESVRLHLRSDVPVGCALSGGIDSSAILCTMRKLQPQLDLHAVSFVASDPNISEENWIDLAAQKCSAHVHKTKPNGTDMASDLDSLVRAQGEPFGSTSIYAQFSVFRQARGAGLTVMLDGQGADEMLAGYNYFPEAHLKGLCRKGQWTEALGFGQTLASRRGQTLTQLVATVTQATIRRAVRRRLPAALLRYRHARNGSNGVMNRGYFADVHASDVVNPFSGQSRGGLHDVLWESLLTSSLPALLRYEDRNSMAFSIESRVPFLTRSLVEFILSLPETLILDESCISKAVFRAAMRGTVPDAILDRRDKIGFAAPEKTWLLEINEWVENTLSSDRARAVPAIDSRKALDKWHQIVSGAEPYQPQMWRCINLIAWAEAFDVTF